MIHLAGALGPDLVQRCIICGYVLSDYRGAMMLDTEKPLTGFPEGAHVSVTVGMPTVFMVTADRWNCRVPR